jgi:hypothetical protein
VSSWIYFLPGLMVGIVGWFAIGLIAHWLYSSWRRTIGGMHDEGSVIADQGDDWSVFPWSVRDEKPAETIWVIPRRQPPTRVVIDRSRPAWHSAVGVELAGREVSK